MDEKSRLGRIKTENREPVDEFEPWVLGAVGLGEPWGSILGTDLKVHLQERVVITPGKWLPITPPRKNGL